MVNIIKKQSPQLSLPVVKAFSLATISLTLICGYANASDDDSSTRFEQIDVDKKANVIPTATQNLNKSLLNANTEIDINGDQELDNIAEYVKNNYTVAAEQIVKRPIIDMFNQALTLKSSDPQTSQKLLLDLLSRRVELSEEQHTELLFLDAYLQTLNENYYRALDIYTNLTMLGQDNIALRAYSYMLNLQILNSDYGRAAGFIQPINNLLASNNTETPLSVQNNALIIIGKFYRELGKYQDSQLYLDKIVINPQNKREQCFIKVHRNTVNLYLNKFISTAQPVLDTIELCSSINETRVMHAFVTHIAYFNIQQQQYQQAINLLLGHLNSAEQINRTMTMAKFYSYLSHSYQQLKQYDLAYTYANKSLESVNITSDRLPAKLSYQVLYQQALSANDDVATFQYLEHYIEANDAYLYSEHLKYLGLEQGNQNFSTIEAKLNLYTEQLFKNSAEQKINQTANDSYYLYIIFLYGVQLTFILFFCYQLLSVAKVLIKSKKQRAMLVYDFATTAYLREDFLCRAKQVIADAKATDISCSLVLFNLDDLRSINEYHNNDRGNWAIKFGVRACIKAAPKNALFGRLGGDEFAVLLPNNNLASATNIAEKLRVTFEDLDTSIVSYHFNSFASFGVTDTHVSGYNIKALIEHADVAMQQVKKAGGNQVFSYKTSNP
ncbi:GGDEF domain-containing protein [Colwelliaceae bacterium BS250]